MDYVLKTIISAILIVVITELSKRSSLIGGLTASLPLLSVIAMIWLYRDTENIEKVIKLSYSIFWLVIPSLSLFLLFPYMLKRHISFYPALFLSCLVTAGIYYCVTYLYTRLGIRL